MTRRPQQSGFVAGRSRMAAILSDLHREFDRPLNVAYLDIKAAFDSVDRLGLWKALRSRGVPDVLLDLIVALHQGTGVQVRQGQNLSERLLTTSGIRQGCVLAPALFCVAIDWILRHMEEKPGIEVGCEHFSDLVYADDTAFLINTTFDAVLSDALQCIARYWDRVRLSICLSVCLSVCNVGGSGSPRLETLKINRTDN